MHHRTHPAVSSQEFFDKYFDTPVQPEEFDTFKAYIDLTVPDSSPTASPLWLFNGETSSLVPGEDIDGRTMVRWLWSLLVHSMFDEAAAAHGLVLVNNMAGLGMHPNPNPNPNPTTAEALKGVAL